MLLLVRLGQLWRLNSVPAALLTLLAYGATGALVPHRANLVAGSPGSIQAAAADPASAAALLAITADSQSLVARIDEARTANAAIPLIANGLQPAHPFDAYRVADLTAAPRAQQCLALAMYYEAGFEGRDGRLAVAQVVLNRVRHPAFPHDVCSVVFQHSVSDVCQFTFACDGAMQRPRLPGLWSQALAEAGAALHGKVFAPVGMATHYHADYVFPRWAPRLEKVAVIGHHMFYRWPNGWGLRRAFTAGYAGSEPALGAIEQATPDLIVLPPELTAAAGEIAPIRSANEAGFVDPSKGWVPRISQPRPSPEPTAAAVGPAGEKPAP